LSLRGQEGSRQRGYPSDSRGVGVWKGVVWFGEYTYHSYMKERGYPSESRGMERRGLVWRVHLPLLYPSESMVWFKEYTYHSYIPLRAGIWKGVVWRVHLSLEVLSD
jgi:hypothetical protein